MEKIGIVTAHREYNYGSKLQAYAMATIVEQMNFQPEIIEFHSLRLNLFSLKFLIRTLFCKISRRYKNQKDMDYIRRDFPNFNNYWKKIFERRKSIEEFDKFLPIRQITCPYWMLGLLTKSYKAVICGSDQIWRPVQNPLLRIFLLDFLFASVRRIAYAPSLGVDSIPDDLISTYINSLSKFHSLSCREIETAKILSGLVGRKVYGVLDPTLLIGRKEWDKIIDENFSMGYKKYILCYMLGTNVEHRNLCSNISKALNMPILNFSHFKVINEGDIMLHSIDLYDVTPCQFIGLIKNASLIITDSFHCTIFSIMYQKEFLTLLRYKDTIEMSTNSRLRSILNKLHLESRIVESNMISQELFNSKVDYSYCNTELNAERKNDWNYISNSLKGI